MLKNNPRQADETVYASILSDGKIHVVVDESTEGAIKREYESSTGKKGVKWEHLYTELSGTIQKVQFQEGEFGVNILVTVGDESDEKPITLALGTTSNFGEDLMKKYPNIDLKKPVTFSPFSFKNEKGKNTRGISITQKNKKGEVIKIVSHYYDSEKKKVTNGYPTPLVARGGKPIKSSEWRKYFEAAREFMIEDLRDNHGVTDREVEGESAEDTKARQKANKEF